MYKVDLHTHSCASPDGGLQYKHYLGMFKRNTLDCIAVTDHNTIEFAKKLHSELGKKIIVGEEISTQDGEIIGLFLQEVIPSGLSAKQTVRAIHKQGGLVYIPHPFETVRSGLSIDILDRIAGDIDIIEIHNGRAVFQNRSSKATGWSIVKNVPGAASSDAHGMCGWGKTFNLLRDYPSVNNICSLLKTAEFQTGTVGLRGLLYPKYNRLRKWLKHD